MTTKAIKAGLTKGLVSGYGGKTKFSTVTRGSFQLNASHLQEGDLTYHDEWLPSNTGGGQELIKVGNRQFTRLYAGGVVKQNKLKKLGITKKDVIDFLKTTILKQREKTRLFQSCQPKPKTGWSYSYQILDNEKSIPVIFAKETISFHGQVVFVHSFLLCPIT